LENLKHYIVRIFITVSLHKYQIKEDEMGTCRMHSRCESLYSILVRKPEGKRPLGRPGCRWEDNIRMNLREIGWDGMDWIHLIQDQDKWLALVNMVMNLQVP
jgi:hypothetical protein